VIQLKELGARVQESTRVRERDDEFANRKCGRERSSERDSEIVMEGERSSERDSESRVQFA
jgi:hypothetical protein